MGPGNAFGWWHAPAGTVMVQATSPASGTRVVWQADDGTANNRITLYTVGSSLKLDVVTAGVTQASLTLGAITAGAAFKAAFAFAANDVAGVLAGGAVQTDASAALPAVDRCRFGADVAGNQLCGSIQIFRHRHKRHSNAELQALTA